MPLYYEDIAVSSGGESHLVRPIKVVDWVLPDMIRIVSLTRVIIDEIIALDSTPITYWDKIRLLKYEDVPVYADVGQNNPLVVSDYITTELGFSKGDTTYVQDIVLIGGRDLTKEVDPEVTYVTENVIPKFPKWVRRVNDTTPTSDRATPYMSPRSMVMEVRPIELSSVVDIPTKFAFSIIKLLVVDNVGVSSSARLAGQGDSSGIYSWRFRYDY